MVKWVYILNNFDGSLWNTALCFDVNIFYLKNRILTKLCCLKLAVPLITLWNTTYSNYDSVRLHLLQSSQTKWSNVLSDDWCPLYLPSCEIDRLQSVFNAAAHFIAGVRRYDHVTLSLAIYVHWLRISRAYTSCVYWFTAVSVVLLCPPKRGHPTCRNRRNSPTTSLSFDPATRRLPWVTVTGPRACHELPADVQGSANLHSFKYVLKTQAVVSLRLIHLTPALTYMKLVLSSSSGCWQDEKLKTVVSRKRS